MHRISAIILLNFNRQNEKTKLNATEISLQFVAIHHVECANARSAPRIRSTHDEDDDDDDTPRTLCNAQPAVRSSYACLFTRRVCDKSIKMQATLYVCEIPRDYNRQLVPFTRIT